MDIRQLKIEADYEAALRQVDALMDAAPGSTEEAELEVLSTIVEAYEEHNFPIDPPIPLAGPRIRSSS